MSEDSQFPPTVYVRHADDGDYLEASAFPAGGIEERERCDVGVYVLKEVVKVEWTKNVTMTPHKPHKKRRRK